MPITVRGRVAVATRTRSRRSGRSGGSLGLCTRSSRTGCSACYRAGQVEAAAAAGRPGQREAFRHAAPTIAAAGLILAGTFASLTLAGNTILAQLGFAVSCGIALAAFVMAMFFSPSLIGHRTSVRHTMGSVSCLSGLMTEAGGCWIIR